jgi:hypothetical protein
MPSSLNVPRCECGGSLLPLVFEGDRARLGGRVCATCRNVVWGNDMRDSDVPCCCEGRMDMVSIRWYHRLYAVGEGCLRCSRLLWWMDEPGAKLHSITEGIANVIV